MGAMRYWMLLQQAESGSFSRCCCRKPRAGKQNKILEWLVGAADMLRQQVVCVYVLMVLLGPTCLVCMCRGLSPLEMNRY